MWKKIQAWGQKAWEWVIKKPAALAAAALVIIGGILLVLFKKDLQIGGILSSLLGEKKKPNLRVVPPEKRVRKDGSAIQPGESDERGFTQAPVSTTIKKPGLFSKPDEIVIEHPTKGNQTIKLPTGVKNKDVREVIEIEPDIYEVKNNDKPSVDTDKLLAILDD